MFTSGRLGFRRDDVGHDASASLRTTTALDNISLVLTTAATAAAAVAQLCLFICSLLQFNVQALYPNFTGLSHWNLRRMDQHHPRGYDLPLYLFAASVLPSRRHSTNQPPEVCSPTALFPAQDPLSGILRTLTLLVAVRSIYSKLR